MKTFHLRIHTPDQEIFDGDNVASISTSTKSGPIVVQAGHASLTGTVNFSRTRFTVGDKEEEYLIRRGTIYVDNAKNEVTLLAFSCEKLSEVSTEGVTSYLEHINELLSSGKDLSGLHLRYLEGEKVAMEQQVQVLEKEGKK